MRFGRIWAGALAGVALLGLTGSARASDDMLPLKGGAGVGAVTMTLGSDDDDADTELVQRRGGGGRGGRAYGGARGGSRGGRAYYGGARGGYRGGYGGYRGGYRGYYGGYRGYYGGYRGYYRPYYYGGYYRPYRYGAYYRPYYPMYGYNYACNDVGAGATVTLVAPPSGVQVGSGFYGDPNYPPIGPGSQIPPVDEVGGGIYPYNGGPQSPVPLPGSKVNQPAKTPPATVPLEGRLVSLPGPAPRLSYPAYGEGR